jgi:CheY-like chemotaxis protein
MSDNKVIVISATESFIPRVLVNKINETGVGCGFAPCTVEGINDNLDSAVLIVLFMEEDEIPDERIIHFLSDTVEEKSVQLILVGEQADIQQVCSRLQPDAVYRSFTRPVDNKVFADTVKDYVEKADSGAFKKSILIVDDDPQYLTMVREWLKVTYKVSMVNSGLQAIKWLGKNKVDLILLDHEMPVTSGPQVLEMLRSDSETCNIPVIFLTGKGDKESVMAVVALRPDGYLLKGIQKEELLEKIQEFFILHK